MVQKEVNRFIRCGKMLFIEWCQGFGRAFLVGLSLFLKSVNLRVGRFLKVIKIETDS